MSSFTPLIEDDASYWVNAKATYYPHKTEIYIPNQPYRKLKPGLELVNNAIDLDDEEEKEHSYSETDTERSMRRSKKTIKEYVFCNEFDAMATFTFNDNNGDRQDENACRRKMRDWLKSQQKYHGKFDYLIVSELHKDPQAIHYHALINKFTGRIERATNPYTGKPLVKNGRRVFQYPGYTHGYTTVKLLGDSEEDRIRAGFYVMKYITKENTNFFGKNRYWTSRSLKRPSLKTIHRNGTCPSHQTISTPLNMERFICLTMNGWRRFSYDAYK